ncbi:hypothetical protein [Mycobacterium sp. NS-7484]|uniref:hypothetical protein n=1 Tax=Mycobacterium sp. NS-7484 TaxID=1834161 RepID=UPI00114FBD1A|nr:hypothetical protein [Mycobacterium sp. NS-7484]
MADNTFVTIASTHDTNITVYRYGDRTVIRFGHALHAHLTDDGLRDLYTKIGAALFGSEFAAGACEQLAELVRELRFEGNGSVADELEDAAATLGITMPEAAA